MIRLCFVCLGNICRSPTAEGVMLHLVRDAGIAHKFVIDSAGTAAYHVGERADPRSIAAARRHQVALPSIARRFVAADFERFDFVLAMDRSNQADLIRLSALGRGREKVQLLRSFDAESVARGELDVPDPYYGGDEGFERVFQICRAACEGLLDHLRARLP
jgi:protein-tyrosine phosphatase